MSHLRTLLGALLGVVIGPALVLLLSLGVGCYLGFMLSPWLRQSHTGGPSEGSTKEATYPGLRPLGRGLGLFVPRPRTRPRVRPHPPHSAPTPASPGVPVRPIDTTPPRLRRLRRAQQFGVWRYVIREVLPLVYPHTRRRTWAHRRGRMLPLSFPCRLRFAQWLGRSTLVALQPDHPHLPVLPPEFTLYRPWRVKRRRPLRLYRRKLSPRMRISVFTPRPHPPLS